MQRPLPDVKASYSAPVRLLVGELVVRASSPIDKAIDSPDSKGEGAKPGLRNDFREHHGGFKLKTRLQVVMKPARMSPAGRMLHTKYGTASLLSPLC